MGEEFDLQCPKCAVINHYSVDDVKAENGLMRLIIFVGGIGAIGIAFYLLKQFFSISTWWIIPALIAIPVTFYATFSKEENERIRSFNRFKLKN